MTVKVIPYNSEYLSRWEQFVAESAQGCFLHTRKYLSYHRDRFIDRSLLAEDSSGRISAIFPAAISNVDPTEIVSHPGITFGGLLHVPGCRPAEIIAFLECAFEAYRSAGFKRLIYKAVPLHAQRMSEMIDQHAIWRVGGRLVRRDLWNVVSLRDGFQPRKRHKWSIKKAAACGVQVRLALSEDYKTFYDNLRDNLKKRYGVRPTHSLSELIELRDRFPEKISLWIAQGPDKRLIAGVLLFKYQRNCWHTQYITSCEEGRRLFALSLILEHIFRSALASGVDTISFGSSTENGGLHVNSGLFEFKSGLGSGSIVQEFFEVDLSQDTRRR